MNECLSYYRLVAFSMKSENICILIRGRDLLIPLCGESISIQRDHPCQWFTITKTKEGKERLGMEKTLSLFIERV